MTIEYQNQASFFKPRYADRYAEGNFKVVAEGKVSGETREAQSILVKTKTKEGKDIFRVYAEVGAVFPNDTWTDGGQNPKYTGSITVNDHEQRLALWENHKDTIGKYLKGKVTDKQEQAPQPSAAAGSSAIEDDGVPF